MRILLLAPANSIHTIKWANAFSERGHEVFLTSLSDHRADLDKLSAKVTLHYLSKGGGKGYYLCAGELKKYFKKIKPDVVNAHYASGYGTLARMAGIHPLVLNVWGSDVYEFPYKGKYQNIVIKRNINNADAIASTSNCMAEEVRKVLNRPETEITIVPFGVDVNRFRPEPERTEKDHFLFGTVKLLSYNYGIDLLIRAFALFKKRWEAEGSKGKVPRYFICGRGPDRTDFEKLVNDLSLDGDIEISDYIPNEVLPSVINSFDVSCYASVQESFGVSVVESMACGIPVITTETDGFREVSEEGVTGLFVHSRDEKEFADRMWELYNDDTARKLFGENGRKRVLELYDWQKNVSILETLLAETSK